MGRRKTFHRDYYGVLGLEEGVGEEEVKRAYRRLALEFHPDRNPGNKEAEERFKEISEAYACLMDKEKREEYTRWRRGGFAAGTGRGGPFSFGQEEILRSFFIARRAGTSFRIFKESSLLLASASMRSFCAVSSSRIRDSILGELYLTP